MSSPTRQSVKRSGETLGYAGLLNLHAEPHWTIFLSDFPLAHSAVRRLSDQLADSRTRTLFLRIDRGLRQVRGELRAAGVRSDRDYVSLQGILSRFESIGSTHRLFQSLTHVDLARLDLPFAGTRFRRSFATHLLDVVLRADYAEQERISARFFRLLEQEVPYRVTVRTVGGAQLDIVDDRPWFELAGPLQEGESRALPGGEVAYTGARIQGSFTIDGALLPSPQTPAVGRLAARLGELSRYLRTKPLHLVIRDGRVADIEGHPTITSPLARLFDADERYREVTEVGVSFNRACHRFIHDWPAASNEGRPGVHIGLGGDPERNDNNAPRGPALVHIDLIAATSEVWVNGGPFLCTLP